MENELIFHRIVIQVPDSKHNKTAIESLMDKLPELLGPIHGPHEIIKLEHVKIVQFAAIQPDKD